MKSDRKPSYAQEVMLRVSWSVLNHKDGQPQHVRRGEVMLDLGLEQAPDPELTSDEMQQVAFAAKMAALRALGRRPKAPQTTTLVPMTSVKMWIGNLDGDRQGLVIAPSKERARKIVGTSRADFENHWVRQSGVNQGLEFEVLYTRVMGAADDQWQQGRCQLGAKP